MLGHVDRTAAVIEYRVEVGDARVALGRDDILVCEVGDDIAQGSLNFRSIDLSFPAKPAAKAVIAVVVIGAKTDLEPEVRIARGVTDVE